MTACAAGVTLVIGMGSAGGIVGAWSAPEAAAAQATTTPAMVTVAATTAPDYGTWISDVTSVTQQAHTFVEQRTAAASGEKLAMVLDIDNTSLATYYKGGYPTPAVPPVLDLAKYARTRGVAVFFVTARPDFLYLPTLINLTSVGYPVVGLYGRSLPDLFEQVSTFKTEERKEIEAAGYKIIANVGNSTSDLVGGYAEQTFKLPDYNGLLD